MIVLLDIDGTLLNSNHRIEDDTIKAIAQFSSINHFILCSARKPSSTILIAKQLKLKEKIIICYNGALIMDGKQKIFEKTLSTETVKHVFLLAQRHNLTINIYSDDLWFVNSMNDFVLCETRIIGEKPVEIKDNTELQNLAIHKILLLGTEEKLELLKNKLDEINNITVCKSKPGYLEITSFQANKKNAFEYLIKYLSVDIMDSLAIGDGYNDLELLQCVGIGIAMDNSPDGVKKNVKYVTYSNDRNGVGVALNKFLK